MNENPKRLRVSRTIMPPIEHLKTTPDYTAITDLDRKRNFTNFNQVLTNITRQIKYK